MKGVFHVVVLGCYGGPRESNLSGYLAYPTADPEQLIALDAGTLLRGLDVAQERNSLSDFRFTYPELTPVGEVFIHKIKAYAISHAHLDHIAGLVIASQADGAKAILGTNTTLEDLQRHIFNWVIWPNYGNEGTPPCLNKYRYVHLPLKNKVTIPGTEMTAEAHLLSHPHDYPSTAFFIEHQGDVLLYFGDTSPDAIEKEKRLEPIWERAAQMIRDRTLAGILLECSLPNEEHAKVCYGHLTPKMLMQELHVLQRLAGVPLKHLKVVVTHRKEEFLADQDFPYLISSELTKINDLGIHFIFPSQGDRIVL